MPEPGSNGNGFPWWVRAISLIGGPMVILLIVLRLFTTDLQAAKEAAVAAREESRAALTHLREHQDMTIRLIQLLERVCRRVSKSDFDREGCDD